MILSDESINSYGFWVLTEGIGMERFLKNPIMLFNHHRTSRGKTDEILPIGRWENLTVENGVLYGTPVFDEKDEFAMKIKSKLESGILSSCSIGISVKTWSEDAKYLPMTPAPRWTSELKYELSHHGHKTLNNAFVALGLECNLAQDHYYKVDDTETRTPAYTLLSLTAGTDLNIRKKKIAELYVTAENLLDTAYQNHLSRLKYGDVNNVTGRQGVFNMGRNIVFKVMIPIIFN